MNKRTKADYTVDELNRQASAAADLIEYLKSVDDDDEDLVNDGLEGETEFLHVLDHALDQIDEAEHMATMCQARIEKLTQRMKRFKNKAVFLRHCVSMAMASANGPEDGDDGRPLPFTLYTPAATVTLKRMDQNVIIEDEAKVPARFWRQPDPVLDRKKLNQYVAAWRAYWSGVDAQNSDVSDVIEGDEGEPAEEFPKELPAGVQLSDPGFQLTIRRR